MKGQNQGVAKGPSLAITNPPKSGLARLESTKKRVDSKSEVRLVCFLVSRYPDLLVLLHSPRRSSRAIAMKSEAKCPRETSPEWNLDQLESPTENDIAVAKDGPMVSSSQAGCVNDIYWLCFICSDFDPF
jgi:hypothetical protein